MKIVVIILNIVLLIGLIPAIYAVLGSFMVFDAGENPTIWRVFMAIIALPIVIVICQIISWIAFFRQNYDFAFKVSLIPIVNLIIIGLFLLLVKQPNSSETEQPKTEQTK
ncbi:hypothetical protein EMA8858_00087 [Emticicia aquatica]|jgi:hypothetical protein|uniref:DUF805 domain-containing protein n=1 Tax=Emticicia aquatica TaxID=1681835 RepID=A0ABN8ESY9_9BACT|nr:hypothetical protein [Emticicia aquatica]CAH0993982.1 hypothetical protein EMA8858_00087 [Emticicia aquatica]